MGDAVGARFRRPRWLPQASAVVLLAALVTGFVLVRAERRENHNTDALARACGGVLPADAVRALLPDDEWWRARTGPGPRGLVSCGVGADGGELDVTATPVLDAPLKGVRIEQITGDPYEREPRWAEDHRRADVQVTVACPGGLPGYPRPVRSFRVHGSLSGETTGAAPRDAVAPAVAAVADGLRVEHRCGGASVRPADVKPFTGGAGEAPDDPADPADADGKATPESCRWFRTADLGAGWKPTGERDRGSTHPAARGCDTGALKGTQALGVTSASWWGELLPEVRTEYGRELAAAGQGTPPRADARSFTVAAWAEARCAEGPGLHRVSVTGSEKGGLADRADALLGRYLEAAHCRDSKSLGTVWQ
ncbi:hypothetical protein ACFU3J_02570 [Streptomyces sp. NPDC057411]|uniref:hypothetical protein n=1 Tax=unclassified Streptomyces TaxID=2593676 RepID=UPI003627EF76